MKGHTLRFLVSPEVIRPDSKSKRNKVQISRNRRKCAILTNTPYREERNTAEYESANCRKPNKNNVETDF